MAVRRTESARENIMHQNFQSFGTPWERLLGGLGEDDLGGGESMAELAVVQVGEKRKRVKDGYYNERLHFS
jgi:hypothetical protein